MAQSVKRRGYDRGSIPGRGKRIFSTPQGPDQI
jgi:hypothetical protein